jgi:hypothetical protein
VSGSRRGEERRRRWRVLLPLLAIIGLLACEGDPALPVSDEPLLYLVLNQRTTAALPPGQYAFLLTAGSVLEPTYRAAERFEMRRRSDGALFAWRHTGKSGTAPADYAGLGMIHANYYLPDATSPEGLGAAAIVPGETYDLRIETAGRVLQGTVTTPARFTISVEQGSRERVAWPRVPGAVGYSVEAEGLTSPAIQTDTSFSIPAGPGGPVTVVVHALDPHLYAFQSDERLGRAGIDDGYGLYGAITTSRTTLGENAPALHRRNK